MAKTSADYYNDATEYKKKATELSEAKEELSANIAKVVEKFNAIGSSTNEINSVISTTDDSLVSEMSLRNEEMNLAIDKTINKISTDEVSAYEAIDKDIQNYEDLAETAMGNYRTAKANEEAALKASAASASGVITGGDGINKDEVK